MRSAFLSASLLIPVLLAGPAQALSCMQPDVQRSYGIAAESENSWYIVNGKLSFDKPEVPERDLNDNDPEIVVFPAVVEGMGLTGQGFMAPVQADIQVVLTCQGPWCADVPPEGDALLFMVEMNGALQLQVSPCGGQVFPEPDTPTLNRVLACTQGSGCMSASLRPRGSQPAAPEEGRMETGQP